MIKKGIQSSEFWLTMLAQVVGIVLLIGDYADLGILGKGLVFAAQALAAMGYVYGRSTVKKAEAVAKAASDMKMLGEVKAKPEGG